MMERDWRAQCCSLLDIENPRGVEPFNLVTPRSHCPKCRHKLGAIENIPVVSYLFLRGRCKKCQSNIPIHYPLVELLSAISAVIVAYHFGISIQALLAIFLTWALIVLAMIDFQTQLLPDDITLPFLWFGILANFFNCFEDLHSSILGAIFGYGSLWSVYIIFKLVTGKEGMGHGDFKLFAMLGAWLGWKLLPLIILISSLAGAVVGMCMIIFTSHDKADPIPFGPYLVVAGWISMLWGDAIMSAYLNLSI